MDNQFVSGSAPAKASHERSEIQRPPIPMAAPWLVFPHGKVLSSPPPTDNLGCVVYLLFKHVNHFDILEDMHILAFCRPRDTEWRTKILFVNDPTDDYNPLSIKSLLFFGGKLYAFCKNSLEDGWVIQIDIHQKIWHQVVNNQPRLENQFIKIIKLEHADFTWIGGGEEHSRYIEHWVESGNEIFKVHLNCSPRGFRKVASTHIFKLDFSSMTWVLLKSLGDHVLFLCTNMDALDLTSRKCYSTSTSCCSAADMGLERGCLFYTLLEDQTLFTFEAEDNATTVIMPCLQHPTPWFLPTWIMMPTTENKHLAGRRTRITDLLVSQDTAETSVEEEKMSRVQQVSLSGNFVGPNCKKKKIGAILLFWPVSGGCTLSIASVLGIPDSQRANLQANLSCIIDDNEWSFSDAILPILVRCGVDAEQITKPAGGDNMRVRVPDKMGRFSVKFTAGFGKLRKVFIIFSRIVLWDCWNWLADIFKTKPVSDFKACYKGTSMTVKELLAILTTKAELWKTEKCVFFKGKRQRPPIPMAAPWIVFPHGKGRKFQNFYNPCEPNNINCIKSIPEMQGRAYYHKPSHQGWLIVIGNVIDKAEYSVAKSNLDDCFLWNPVSFETIQLPNLDRQSFSSKSKQYFLFDLVLSSPPSLSTTSADPDNLGCIVFLLFKHVNHRNIIEDMHVLAFCRPGDTQWRTKCYSTSTAFCSGADMGLEKGCLFNTLLEDETVYIFEIEDNATAVIMPCLKLPAPWFMPTWIMMPTTEN
ncbi:hypothetical protein C5167_019940, partial [Papaver somniferum]